MTADQDPPAGAEQGRELAVLDGGPWAGSRALHARGGQAQVNRKVHYLPTEQWRAHPDPAYGPGRVWAYQPPTEPAQPPTVPARVPVPVTAAGCCQSG